MGVNDAAPPQRKNEISRVSVTGRRIGDGDKCTVLLVHEVRGTWAFYPHGYDKFGVRLPDDEAVQVAKAILDGSS